MADRLLAHISPQLPRFGRRSILAVLFDRLALYRQRQALLTMSDHQLADLGLTRRAAVLEAQKGLWDAPLKWRR